MAIDLLTEYDWNDPASLGLPPSVVATFAISNGTSYGDFDYTDGFYRDGCGGKRWKHTTLCDVAYAKLPTVGREAFALDWATLVTHAPTVDGRGGVYYTSADGACTLEWFPCSCIWNLNVVWDATPDSDGGSFNEIFRYTANLPDYTWQIPPFPLGLYYGSLVDTGSNRIISTQAEVTLPP